MQDHLACIKIEDTYIELFLAYLGRNVVGIKYSDIIYILSEPRPLNENLSIIHNYGQGRPMLRMDVVDVKRIVPE